MPSLDRTIVLIPSTLIDLKPGNIMLTKSGAKLLDFGLAKTNAPGVAGSLSMLPTTPPNLTAPGTILGTFQYMAPEQLEGHEADARTDVFAFGALLHEMVTGKKAFQGKSQASLIAAILEHEPPAMSTLQRTRAPRRRRVQCPLDDVARLAIQHRYRLLGCVQIAAYNPHLGLLRPEHCEGGHRTVYAGRREADVVMTSFWQPPRVHDFVTAAGSVLDIPVTLNIKIDELAVKLQPGSIKLDVLR